MLTVKDNTTLVGVSELRAKLDTLLKVMKDSNIVLEKRRKAIAVLIPMDRFEEMEKLLDLAEDLVLGLLAKGRDRRSSDKDYIPLEAVERKLGLR